VPVWILADSSFGIQTAHDHPAYTISQAEITKPLPACGSWCGSKHYLIHKKKIDEIKNFIGRLVCTSMAISG